MSEETSNQKQQQQQPPPPQQQHVTSWPGKQVETLRLWEEAVKARKKGKTRWSGLRAWLNEYFPSVVYFNEYFPSVVYFLTTLLFSAL